MLALAVLLGDSHPLRGKVGDNESPHVLQDVLLALETDQVLARLEEGFERVRFSTSSVGHG